MEKSGDGAIDGVGIASVTFLQLRMLIPEVAIARCRVGNGQVADAGLGKAPREE